jgi:hypothetical protein
MVDDLAGDGDGTVGRVIADGDKERTSLEPGIERLATVSLTEARKET